MTLVNTLFNKKYGVGISFNEKNIGIIGKKLRKFNFEKQKENIRKAREDYDMDKNFPRLEEFIKKVVEYKASKK